MYLVGFGDLEKRQYSRQFPHFTQRIALRKLKMLNRAKDLKDLSTPAGNRLEALKGKRKGQYSIHINDQWRICFKWKQNDAFNVEINDYH
jgi:proteic killer suppression protein